MVSIQTSLLVDESGMLTKFFPEINTKYLNKNLWLRLMENGNSERISLTWKCITLNCFNNDIFQN